MSEPGSLNEFENLENLVGALQKLEARIFTENALKGIQPHDIPCHSRIKLYQNP